MQTQFYETDEQHKMSGNSIKLMWISITFGEKASDINTWNQKGLESLNNSPHMLLPTEVQTIFAEDTSNVCNHA